MPQNRKPARLWLRKERDASGKLKPVWVIKDGTRNIRTGCVEAEAEEAQRKLHEYLSEQFEPVRGGSASEVTVGDILAVYDAEVRPTTARPKETESAIQRLNEFFGDKPVNKIKGRLCRAFTEFRKTASGARRDLEILRAAIRYYHKEYGLDVVPTVTLPGKSLPRDTHLTRTEAAALLWSCMGWEKNGKVWKRKRDQKRSHLARLVLIGLYTGTRPGAILGLQWMSNTQGGYADLERQVIYRRAEGERVAHNKRKPPVKIARKLLGHLKRWKAADGWDAERGKTGIRYVVHYLGKEVTKPNKAFRSAIKAAGLSAKVTPHVLRHTRGTWLAQSGVPAGEASASLGLTIEEYERTYLHHDPAFQEQAANAY